MCVQVGNLTARRPPALYFYLMQPADLAAFALLAVAMLAHDAFRRWLRLQERKVTTDESFARLGEQVAQLAELAAEDHEKLTRILNHAAARDMTPQRFKLAGTGG